MNNLPNSIINTRTKDSKLTKEKFLQKTRDLQWWQLDPYETQLPEHSNVID